MDANGREYYGEDADDVKVQYVGTAGFYWSSNTIGSGAYVLEVRKDYSTINTLSGFEYACSVRCVQE
jgi:hypothetical protein